MSIQIIKNEFLGFLLGFKIRILCERNSFVTNDATYRNAVLFKTFLRSLPTIQALTPVTQFDWGSPIIVVK